MRLVATLRLLNTIQYDFKVELGPSGGRSISKIGAWNFLRRNKYSPMTDYFDLVARKLLIMLSEAERRRIDAILHQNFFMRATPYEEHLHYFYWEQQAEYWSTTPSPIRPSTHDLDGYQHFLERCSRSDRVLILGSTPELRDLVSKHGVAEVCLADFSYRMPATMLQFTRHVEPARETWVKANWFNLPFPTGFFDIILGDLVLQQFPPKLEPKFLERIGRLLRDDGAFIGRFHFLGPELQRGTIAEVVAQTLGSDLSDHEKFILLKLRTLWLFADVQNRELRRDISAAKLGEFVNTIENKPPLLKDVYAATTADRDSYRRWSPPSEAALFHTLSQSFSIRERVHARDYPEAHYYPLLKLIPRHTPGVSLGP